jgi:hypothetical protein
VATCSFDCNWWTIFADLNAATTVSNRFGEIFKVPAPYTLGNVKPDNLRRSSTAGIHERFTLWQRVSARRKARRNDLELRIEAKNAFNHPLFSAPDTSVDDSSFGQITYAAVGPREVQLAIKFNF